MRDSTAANIGASGASCQLDMTLPFNTDMHCDAPLVLSDSLLYTNGISRASPAAEPKSTLTPTRPRKDVRVSDTRAGREIICIGSSDEDESLGTGKPRTLMETAQLTTPPSGACRASALQKPWNKADLTTALLDLQNNVRHDHARLVIQAIETTAPVERRIHHGADIFEGPCNVAAPHRKGETMRIQFEQYFSAGTDVHQEHHPIKRIKTTRERVPPYQFHHVNIQKSILAPNTMLTFVPHLRDLDGGEVLKYDSWLRELDDIDTKSGFRPMSREEKVILTVQTERAATLSLYLDTWLEKLGIANCTKAALIAYLAGEEPGNTTKLQTKSNVIQAGHETTMSSATSQSLREAAVLFAGAFKQAFENKDLPRARQVELRRVLLLEEPVDGSSDPKLAATDADSMLQGDIDELTEAHLATYTNLGCLICYSHSCDHGDYDIQNLKRAFSMGAVMPLGELLKQRRRKTTPKSTEATATLEPCRRTCHRSPLPVGELEEAKPWLDSEVVLLKSIFSMLGQSQLRHDSICFAANILNRDCSAVFRKFESLSVEVPSAMPLESLPVKPLSWYCNRRKILIGEWQNHTTTHEHQRREIIDPCSHEGICTSQNCPCVKLGILCEKWCKCSAETCSYKFTGCGCHASGATGKSCQAKGKKNRCLCVELNRECDPALCQSCGVLEKADPHNAGSYILRETGCQNCELQQGSSKQLLLGQSRLDGVGYGLFTAEDLLQGVFVMEYVGELITQDEGVRREARRSDVFDEESNSSYNFTLLEHEGIWIDSAQYGNLSRYINHAEGTASNVTPRILYVNGEYRIKFTALRDIRAGEELFFDYGENFPNLTKKLLDNKQRVKPVSPRKLGRAPRLAAGKIVARNALKQEQRRSERKRLGKGQSTGRKRHASTICVPIEPASKTQLGEVRLKLSGDSFRARGP